MMHSNSKELNTNSQENKMKKFELVAELSKEFLGRKFFRIRALISFGDVSKGDLGGWVEKEECVDQLGDAWVYGDARVYGNAQVSGDAQVYGDAWVYGNAWVSGDAHHITVSPIGSEGGCLTAFRQKDNSIVVRRGCFSGSLEEFEDAVNATHGDSKYAEQYKIVIALIKSRLESVEQSND